MNYEDIELYEGEVGEVISEFKDKISKALLTNISDGLKEKLESLKVQNEKLRKSNKELQDSNSELNLKLYQYKSVDDELARIKVELAKEKTKSIRAMSLQDLIHNLPHKIFYMIVRDPVFEKKPYTLPSGRREYESVMVGYKYTVKDIRLESLEVEKTKGKNDFRYAFRYEKHYDAKDRLTIYSKDVYRRWQDVPESALIHDVNFETKEEAEKYISEVLNKKELPKWITET